MQRRAHRVKKSEWSNKQLEELLRQMPKIQDHLDPQDIYQKIPFKKNKRPTWLIPSIATAAACLLFLILIPKFMDGTQFSPNAPSEEKSSDVAVSKNDSKGALKKQVFTNKDKEDTESATLELLREVNSSKTAVYDNEVGDGTVITYWIPDPQAQILIPVSTIVKQTENKSWISLFNENMAALKEEDWGLSDFYPINATLKFDQNDNSVIVDVPINHQYAQGSTNETNFLSIIKKDVSSNSDVKKIEFSTSGQPGIELGNLGVVNELNMELERNHAYLFYYPSGSQLPYLVPSKNTYKDIKTALSAMGSDQLEAGLKTSLLPTLQFKDASITNKTLLLTIDVNSKLKDDQSTLYSFEAILLTAKEFGAEKVVIENPTTTFIGPFDLSKDIKVPLAPNFRDIQ